MNLSKSFIRSAVRDLATTTGNTPGNQVLGISGSPRENGNSDVLLNQIFESIAKQGIATSAAYLRDIAFQGCIGCEKCRNDKICTGILDGMSLIYPKILSSKGLVLVCPTHNYNITSWMKAFIDRLYCFYDFTNDRPRDWSSQLADQNRKAIVVAVCEQESKEDMGFTLEAMKRPIEALGYDVIGELAVFRVFDKGRVKEDQSTLDQASELGQKMANFMC